MRRTTRHLLFAIALLGSVLAAVPANACQLVCIAINGDDGSGSPLPQGAWAGACTVARAGFKPATAGMVSALPSISPDFFGQGNRGAQNGLDCDYMRGMFPGDPATVNTMTSNCKTALAPRIICCNM